MTTAFRGWRRVIDNEDHITMFVHSVYFWLKPELTAEERAQFFVDIQSLRSIAGVRGCYIGKPDANDRPVIDSSYDCGLILVFDDKAAEEAYILDPIHQAFAGQWRTRWMQVKIYDCVEE